jgi:hypothetical protein
MNITTVDAVLKTIIYVAAIFATLPGLALLVSALVNTIKSVGALFGINFDGKADKVTAWINLAFFVGLIAYGVFTPSASFEWLDGKFKLIADALIAASYFFGQLQLSPMAHNLLRGKLPLVGTSYSVK